MSDYLTEISLGDYLKELFPSESWILNKRFRDSKFRPDFCSETLKVSVEFDGPTHYVTPSTILRDIRKREIVEKAGFRMISIPYWIQLTPSVIISLFKIDQAKDLSNNYPLGFISEKVILPAEFCFLGVERFKKEMQFFSEEVQTKVILSLEQKIKQQGDWRLVVPSLNFLKIEFYKQKAKESEGFYV